jgi:hypothetical protein
MMVVADLMVAVVDLMVELFGGCLVLDLDWMAVLDLRVVVVEEEVVAEEEDPVVRIIVVDPMQIMIVIEVLKDVDFLVVVVVDDN